MTHIEKTTRDGDTLYFQKISTKKELKEVIQMLYSDSVNDGIFTDDDSSAVS